MEKKLKMAELQEKAHREFTSAPTRAARPATRRPLPELPSWNSAELPLPPSAAQHRAPFRRHAAPLRRPTRASQPGCGEEGSR